MLLATKVCLFRGGVRIGIDRAFEIGASCVESRVVELIEDIGKYFFPPLVKKLKVGQIIKKLTTGWHAIAEGKAGVNIIRRVGHSGVGQIGSALNGCVAIS